jgi:hypothetical protein
MNEYTIVQLPELNIVPDKSIRFAVDNSRTEILRIDADGMTYKGQRIEDAGEAHRAFIEAMYIMRNGAKE